MKKITALLTALALILGLCACSQSAVTWQEQYDLGVRYLSEGKYQEAIIAFTAAIEINPKQAEVYLNLADTYIALGDLDSALQTLRDGYAATGDARLQARIDELTAPEPTPTSTATPTMEFTPEVGHITWSLIDGTLTINGTGSMENYTYDGAAPWNEKRDSIREVVIEDGVTNIGNHAFRDCASLTNVTMPNSVTSIGKYAFADCGSLTNITMSDSIVDIGFNAFVSCISLTSMTIPIGVTSIGGFAFQGCRSLASITIPNSVTHIGAGAFYACHSLADIEVASGDPVYCSVDGVLFNADQTLLHTYPAGKSGSSYSIPASVISIGQYAFHGCKGLTSVTIPNSVTTIDEWALNGCGDLTSVTISDSVTSVGKNAFDWCDILTDIYYSGSEAQWSQISIGEKNDPLLNATIHYNS